MQTGHDIIERYIHSRSQNYIKNTRFYWKKFLERMKLDDSILEQDKKIVQTALDNYISYLLENNAPSIRPQFAAVKFVFEDTDLEINWRRIMKRIPKPQETSGNETWSDEDLRKILTNCNNERDRALLTFCISTGCRIGVFEVLKLEDVADYSKGCKKVRISRQKGSTGKQTVFLTPEASRYFAEYLVWRKKRGDPCNDSNPAFAHMTNPFGNLGKAGIYKILYRIEGPLTGTKKIKQKPDPRGHYNIQVTHGFRKWHDTKCKSVDGINPYLFEKMFSHTPRGIPLDATYQKPTDEMLFREFQKYIPHLTLDQTEALTLKNKRIDGFESKFKKLEKQVQDLQFDSRYWQKETFTLEQQLEEIGEN